MISPGVVSAAFKGMASTRSNEIVATRECLRERRARVVALSRRKQGLESPRERQCFQHLSAQIELGPAGISNFSPMDGASDDRFEVTL
jgi:hypothetical protein